MKKVLALMLVAVLCITSVFALDFSFGYMPFATSTHPDATKENPYSGFNGGQFTKATLSQDIGNIEIGVSFATPVPVKFFKTLIVEKDFEDAKDEALAKLQFSTAEASILFNVVNSKVVKLGFGLATGLDGIVNIAKNGGSELYLDAVAKFTLNISSHFGIFASAGIEALKVDFDAESDKVVPLWKGSKKDIVYNKLLGGLTVGFTAGF